MTMHRKYGSLQKAWEVLFPYLLYYLAYNAAYLILAFAYQATVNRFGGAYGQFMTAHVPTVTGVMGGLCMLAGILPLAPMLKGELQERGETFGFVRTKAADDTEAITAAGRRYMQGRMTYADRLRGQFAVLPESGGQAVRRGLCGGAGSLWGGVPSGGGGGFPRRDL